MKNVSQVKHRHTMKAGADLCLLSLMIEQFHLSALNKLTFDNTLASKTLLITVITQGARPYTTLTPTAPVKNLFIALTHFEQHIVYFKNSGPGAAIGCTINHYNSTEISECN